METDKFIKVCRTGGITSNFNLETFLNVFTIKCSDILSPEIGLRRLRQETHQEISHRINQKLKDGCPICQNEPEILPENGRLVRCQGYHIVCTNCAKNWFERKQECPFRCTVSFEQRYQQYLQATTSFDIEEIRTFFTQLKTEGFDFDNHLEQENPGLIIAIENEKKSIVELLLDDFDADPDIVDINGIAALFYAFEKDEGPEYVMTKNLLNSGADIHILHPDGTPYLQKIAMHEDLSLIILIVNESTEGGEEQTCSEGYTLFGKMAMHQLTGIEFLFTFQQNIQIGNVFTNNSTIQVLIEYADDLIEFDEFFKDFVKWALGGTYELTQNNKGHSEIITCVRKNKPHFLDYLLGIQDPEISIEFPDNFINTRDNKGQTAFFAACKRGNIQCARILVEHNADIDIPNSNGVSPLQIAREKGWEEIIQLIIGLKPSEI